MKVRTYCKSETNLQTTLIQLQATTVLKTEPSETFQIGAFSLISLTQDMARFQRGCHHGSASGGQAGPCCVGQYG